MTYYTAVAPASVPALAHAHADGEHGAPCMHRAPVYLGGFALYVLYLFIYLSIDNLQRSSKCRAPLINLPGPSKWRALLDNLQGTLALTERTFTRVGLLANAKAAT